MMIVVSGATGQLGDLPGAEIHVVDTGPFGLDEATDEIASLTRKFLGRLQ